MSGFAVDLVADELAARIGKAYPLREKGQEIGFVLTPEGATQQAGNVLHRFLDADKQWTVTLATTFVTLETTAYHSHEDFIPRLVEVVRELKNYLPLQRWDRFGYRYTNRFNDDTDLAMLPELFNSAVLGTLALRSEDNIVHSVAETVYKSSDASLLVKTAYLPPGASVEFTIPPVPTRAWMLDLDAFSDNPSEDFDDAAINDQAALLAKKAHDFFEMVTTDAYRSRFAS